MRNFMNGAKSMRLALMADSMICHLEDGDEFSLADLAGLDVSDIEEIRFETLPAGVYELEVQDAKLNEGTNKDGDKRFTAEFSFKVLECKATVKAGVDRETLVGKTHGEKFYIDPSKSKEDIAKMIGRIRAFITDMGAESAGTLGDVITNTKGHIFTGKVVEQVDKDDKSISYARLRLDSKKAK
jgi:hypothetical protein